MANWNFVLTSLNSCKATGLDGLPAKFIIDSVESIVEPLAYIVNLSIRSGVFPDDLKRAKIVPIYKKKAKTEPGSYRPVSVLSVISKVLERVICEQLTDYIEKHDYLYELQSGFRSSYSTDSCLIHLSDHILKNQDKGCGSLHRAGLFEVIIEKTINCFLLMYLG